MGQLSLALLGSPTIRHDGQEVSFPTRKTAALLIYVAVEPGRHSRDKLAALFWPDRDADHSRGSLRRTLSFLNAALSDTPAADNGPHVVGRQGLVGLAEPSAVELDLDQLVAACSLARGPAQLPAARLVAHLQPAARLVRGDFLEGFSLGDAPEFEQWVELQRAAVTRRNETLLIGSPRRCQSAGRWTRPSTPACVGWRWIG
jgi:DNA-binding SARP family transcriptional activator